MTALTADHRLPADPGAALEPLVAEPARRSGRAVLRSAFFAVLVLAPVLGMAGYRQGLMGHGEPGEQHLFGPAGEALLTGQWGEVFRAPAIQGGPFELLSFGTAELLGLRAAWHWYGFNVIVMSLLLIGFLATALWPLAGLAARPRRYLFALAGALACLSGVLPWAHDAGHPAQIMVPAMWLAAGAAAQRGRWVLAPVLLGLSAGWETWGLLGAPLLLIGLGPGWAGLRRLVCSGLVALGVAIGLYLPFALTGGFGMFGFAWPVAPGTWVNVIWPQLQTFPWTLRLAQALIAVGVGVLAWLLARRSAEAVWIVPISVLAGRLVSDPNGFPYYWIGPLIVLSACVALAVARRSYLLAGAAAGLGFLVWLGLGNGPVGQVSSRAGFSTAFLAGALAIAMLAGWTARRSADQSLRNTDQSLRNTATTRPSTVASSAGIGS